MKDVPSIALMAATISFGARTLPRIRILSVGQCGFDNSRIRQSLSKPLDAEIVDADTHQEATETLRAGGIDLVLVNRIGDADGAPGLDLIRTIKNEPSTSNVPTLLVSNFASAQKDAIALGAAPGFGKDDLGSKTAIEAIRQALTGSTA